MSRSEKLNRVQRVLWIGFVVCDMVGVIYLLTTTVRLFAAAANPMLAPVTAEQAGAPSAYPGPNVAFDPAAQANFGQPTAFVTHTTFLENQTDNADSFTLNLAPGYTWNAILSPTQTAVLSDGERIPFTVVVEVPTGTAVGEMDSLEVVAVADSQFYTNSTTLDTAVICDPYLDFRGTSDEEVDVVDNIYQYTGQRFAYLLIRLDNHPYYYSINATISGYDPNTDAWDVIAEQFYGNAGLLVHQTMIPPTYTKIRVQVDDGSSGYGMVWYDYQFALCREPVIDLQPAAQEAYVQPGETAVYSQTLTNWTMNSTAFTLTTAGSNWPVTFWHNGSQISETAVLDDLDTLTYTVQVVVPAGADPGTVDGLTVWATAVSSPTIQNSAAITTYVVGDLAFVTLSTDNLVAVVDTASNRVIDAIDVGAAGCSFPWRAAITPDESRVYVSCRYSNNVMVIDSDTFAITHVIGSVPEADGIAFSRDGQYAFLGSHWANQIIVVNTTNYFQLIIPISGNTRSLAAHPFFDLVYATSSVGEILVLDATSISVVDTISVTGEPWDVVVSPDGHWLYTFDRWGAGLAVVDLNTNNVFATLTGLGGLTDLDIAPDGATLYAGTLYDGIRVIDTATLTEVTMVNVNGNVWETAVTCDGSQLYVGSTEDFIPIIDTATYTVSQLPMPGYGARGIAVCPQYVGSGVILTPATQRQQGVPGQMRVYEATLHNETEQTDTFTLALGASLWNSDLSTTAIGPLADGETATFVVTVTIPATANWYDTDMVEVTATSITSPTAYSDTAVFISEAYAPPQISVTPDSLSSTQLVNTQVVQTMTISNGNGVTLTFAIGEHNAANILHTPTTLPAGVTSRIAPVGYEMQATRHQPATEGSVLVFQDVYPWGSSAIETILTSWQIPYVVMGSASMGTENLHAYDLIILAGDQPQSFYGTYNDNVARFTAYVQAGGVLEFHAAAWGWQGGNPNGMPLPGGGIINGIYPYDYNYIALPGHPILGGVPNPFSGNSASHGYFSDLLPGAATLVTAGNTPGGVPTLIEYPLGGGRVIASMQPLEIAWEYGWDGGLILENLIPYAYMQSGGFDIPWLAEMPISGTITTNGSQDITVTFDTTDIQPGTYHGTVLVDNNDPVNGRLTLPVSLTAEPTASMGWVEGYVTDSRFGTPLQATIIAQGQPYTITADINGYYKLWLEAGSYTLQASTGGYVPQTLPVAITAQQGTLQNVALVENVPVLNLAPDSIAVTQAVGDVTVATMTLSNNGPAAMTFAIGERDTTPGLALLSAYARTDADIADIQAQLPATDAHNTGAPTVAPTPVDAFASLQGSVNLLAWIKYTDYDQEYENTLNAIAQYTTFNLTETDTEDPSALAALLATANVFLIPEQELTYGNYLYNLGVNWATVLQAFVNRGGSIVTLDYCNETFQLLQGAGLVDMQLSSCNSYLTLEVVNGQHPLVENVPPTFYALYGVGGYTVNNGEIVVRLPFSNDAVVLAKDVGNGHVAVIGFDFYAYNDEMAHILANAVQWYSNDAPWLITTPITGTVPGYDVQDVQVTLDAAGLQPGMYTANLIVSANDPYTPTLSLPVSMEVQATASMGQVIGTVSDAWMGSPLTATVQLQGVYTTTADPAYGIWAEAGAYTLTAFAAGYMTETVAVIIPAGGTVTQDLALVPAQPRLEGMPESVNLTAVSGFTTTYNFTLSNTGPLPLDYAWHEISPTNRSPFTPVDLTGKKILYDQAHGGGWLNDFSYMVQDVINAGGVITENHTYPVTPAILAQYDILWLSCCGHLHWTADELTAVSNWLATGGAILLHGGNSNAIQDLSNLFDIQYVGGAYYGGITTNIQPHPTTEGIAEVYIDYAPNALTYTQAADVLVYDSANYPIAVAQEQNGGRIVVISVNTFYDYGINNADNRAFMLNIMNWLADPVYTDVLWASINPVTGMIPAYANQDYALTLDATNLTPGTYEMMMALEQNDPAQIPVVYMPVTLEVVARTAAVSAVPNVTANTAVPGHTATYHILITNNGNAPDSFTLAADGVWETALSAATTGVLAVGESFMLMVEVTVPTNATGGIADMTTVTVTSDAIPTVNASVTLTTTADMLQLYLPVVIRP